MLEGRAVSAALIGVGAGIAYIGAGGDVGGGLGSAG